MPLEKCGCNVGGLNRARFADNGRQLRTTPPDLQHGARGGAAGGAIAGHGLRSAPFGDREGRRGAAGMYALAADATVRRSAVPGGGTRREVPRPSGLSAGTRCARCAATRGAARPRGDEKPVGHPKLGPPIPVIGAIPAADRTERRRRSGGTRRGGSGRGGAPGTAPPAGLHHGEGLRPAGAGAGAGAAGGGVRAARAPAGSRPGRPRRGAVGAIGGGGRVRPRVFRPDLCRARTRPSRGRIRPGRPGVPGRARLGPRPLRWRAAAGAVRRHRARRVVRVPPGGTRERAPASTLPAGTTTGAPQVLLAHRLKRLKPPAVLVLREYEGVARECAPATASTTRATPCGRSNSNPSTASAARHRAPRPRGPLPGGGGPRRGRAHRQPEPQQAAGAGAGAGALRAHRPPRGRDRRARHGNSGTGETPIAPAPGLAARQRGVPDAVHRGARARRPRTAPALAHQLLTEAGDGGRPLKLRARLQGVRPLIVDTSSATCRPLAGRRRAAVRGVLSRRHGRGATVVTPNPPLGERPSVSRSERLTGAPPHGRLRRTTSPSSS